MRAWAGAVAVGLAAFGAGRATAPQGAETWRGYDGRTWAQFAPREKHAYVAGFLGGAGVNDAAAAAGASADSGALHHALDSLYTAGALRFAYGEMVYATQLDEFYWWENHVPVPLYIELRELNEKMRKGQEQ
jgi:hypothetical protein